MRELSEFLTENELYVYQNHPKIKYQVLADELGLSYRRVAQMKHDAKKKIIKEKHIERLAERAQQPVELILKRRDIYVVHRALWAYAADLTDIDMRKKQPQEEDPDLKIVKNLIPYFSELLSKK